MSKPPYRPFARGDRAAVSSPSAAPTPPARAVPDTRVLGQLSALRAERVYDEASACADCAAARLADGRDDALCDHHLGDALGLHAQWGLAGPGKKL